MVLQKYYSFTAIRLYYKKKEKNAIADSPIDLKWLGLLSPIGAYSCVCEAFNVALLRKGPQQEWT